MGSMGCFAAKAINLSAGYKISDIRAGRPERENTSLTKPGFIVK
jgi:hypothetical protein